MSLVCDDPRIAAKDVRPLLRLRVVHPQCVVQCSVRCLPTYEQHRQRQRDSMTQRIKRWLNKENTR